MNQLQLKIPVKSSLYSVDIEQKGAQNQANESRSGNDDREWLPCNLREYRQLKLLGDKLLIPCIVRQPHKEPYKGLIICDRGCSFDIQVDNHVITLPKLYVHPDFPEKCRTDRDLSPSKKSRRKKGKGSGSIHYRTIKKNNKEYKQAYYHYEFWSQGDRLIKSSEYIPRKMEAKIIRMNNEKVPVEEILKVLRDRSKRKK
jgi:hypothetical protein